MIQLEYMYVKADLSICYVHNILIVFSYALNHEKTCVLHISENKDTDRLPRNHTADQRLCFRYIDTIPLIPKYFSPLAICLETPKTGFFHDEARIAYIFYFSG